MACPLLAVSHSHRRYRLSVITASATAAPSQANWCFPPPSSPSANRPSVDARILARHCNSRQACKPSELLPSAIATASSSSTPAIPLPLSQPKHSTDATVSSRSPSATPQPPSATQPSATAYASPQLSLATACRPSEPKPSATAYVS